MDGRKDLDLKVVRTLSTSMLVPIGEDEASSEDGMMLNHFYVDLRGAKFEDVAETITLERQFLRESTAFAFDSPEMEDWLAETELAMGLSVDMGVGSAVEVLSALGAVPISSCNGGDFSRGHASDVAHVLFSCEPAIVPDILAAAEAAHCGLINNGPYAELYAENVDNLIEFADFLYQLKKGYQTS